MSATDELRKLLDERGVKYIDNDDERDEIAEPLTTTWEYIQCGYEMVVTATEACDVENKPYLDMDFHHYFTPEQAIAATLGNGTCHMEQIPECRYDDIECNECGICLWGFFMDKPGEGVCSKPNYCPYCGRAVEQ
jgi:hypothetical protein